MQIYIQLWQHLFEFCLEWQVFQKKIVEKINTRILYSITFSENLTLCEIMSKNIVEPDNI